MNSALELLLRSVRELTIPHLWIVAQLLAAVSATAFVFMRTSETRRLRLAFLMALSGGVCGALLFGTIYRVFERIAGRPGDFIGVSSYGALVAIVWVFCRLSKRHTASFGASLDLLAPALAVLVGIGRLGCFFAGCDSGRVTTSLLGVRFPAGTATFREHLAQGLVLATDQWSLSVYPAQLYEAIAALVLAALGAMLAKSAKLKPGTAFTAVALGYLLTRILADALRLPTTNAIYGICTTLIIAVMLVIARASQRAALSDATTAASKPLSITRQPI